MEKVNRKIWFRTIVVAYMVIYIISMLSNNFVLTTVLKPGAALLALYAIRYILNYKSIYVRSITTMRRAFLLWVLIDIASTIGELSIHFGVVDIDLVVKV